MEINKAINLVMQEIGYVKKQKAANLSYTFAGEAALISALRPSMVEHGIYMSVNEILNITRETYVTKGGTNMINTVISAKIRFTHIDGSFVDVAATGEGSDAGDKSANKAMTGLYKYAMRQTFCIETGDDPDKFPSEERQARNSAPTTIPTTIPTDSWGASLVNGVKSPASDIQTARANFAKAFNTAGKHKLPNLPTLKGDDSIEAIIAKTITVKAMVEAANIAEMGA